MTSGGRREVGVVMVSSMQVAGRMVGMRDKHLDPATSYTCFIRGCKDKTGHEQWECPFAFASKHPGRVMPGWCADGTKDPDGWNGSDTTEATRQAWAALMDEGFFAVHPNPNSNFPFPDPTKPGGGKK